MTHAGIALIVQLLCILIGLPAWSGGLVSIGIYVGREHAQAEYRIIQSRYGGRRADAPWWAGFHPAAWSRDAVIDLVAPVLTTAAAAWLWVSVPALRG